MTVRQRPLIADDCALRVFGIANATRIWTFRIRLRRYDIQCYNIFFAGRRRMQIHSGTTQLDNNIRTTTASGRVLQDQDHLLSGRSRSPHVLLRNALPNIAR